MYYNIYNNMILSRKYKNNIYIYIYIYIKYIYINIYIYIYKLY